MIELGEKWKILGLGNELRGDDSAGLTIVESLKIKFPRAPIYSSNGETLNLLNAMEGCEQVLIVDCIDIQSEKNFLILDGYKDKLQKGPGVSSHQTSIAEAIELGKVLGKLPDQLYLVGIPGKTFEIGTNESPRVQQSILEALKFLTKTIEKSKGDNYA